MQKSNPISRKTTVSVPGRYFNVLINSRKQELSIREMAEMMALDLVDKGLVTDQLVLTVGYDIENLSNPAISRNYKGEITIDRYGRSIPKHAHGTQNLSGFTASTYEIIDSTLNLYDCIMNPELLIRRITLTANHVKKRAGCCS